MLKKSHVSGSLAEMLATYRETHPYSDKKMGRQFGVSHDAIAEVRSGVFEQRVRKVASSPGRANVARQVAGTVVRLVRGCGEDETEWLSRLGFSKDIVPIVDTPTLERRIDTIVLNKDGVEMLLKVVELVGELPLTIVIELLEAKARRPNSS
jgi:hypothetical protein